MEKNASFINVRKFFKFVALIAMWRYWKFGYHKPSLCCCCNKLIYLYLPLNNEQFVSICLAKYKHWFFCSLAGDICHSIEHRFGYVPNWTFRCIFTANCIWQVFFRIHFKWWGRFRLCMECFWNRCYWLRLRGK